MRTHEAAPRNKTVLLHNAAVHILEAVMLGSEYVVYGYDLYVHESHTCPCNAFHMRKNCDACLGLFET